MIAFKSGLFPSRVSGKIGLSRFFSFLFCLLPLVSLLSLRHYDHLLRPLSFVPILSFLEGIWGIEVILICFMFFFPSPSSSVFIIMIFLLLLCLIIVSSFGRDFGNRRYFHLFLLTFFMYSFI